jgi:hypothetical protein
MRLNEHAQLGDWQFDFAAADLFVKVARAASRRRRVEAPVLEQRFQDRMDAAQLF